MVQALNIESLREPPKARIERFDCGETCERRLILIVSFKLTMFKGMYYSKKDTALAHNLTLASLTTN